MAENLNTPQVVDLGDEHIDQAAAVLARAFRVYPLTRYIFEVFGERLCEPLQASFRIDCAWQVALGWPLLGVRLGEKLVAAAVVAGPEPFPRDHPLAKEEQRFYRSLGQQVIDRLEAYTVLKERYEPRQAHYYLQDIGVLPEYRSQGHAGRLLRRVLQIVQEDPAACGVALDTQLQANLAIYRRFGFRVTAKTWLERVPMWFMARLEDEE
jgi:ribosomal protein S18 acetylase RimI-like enzyme